MTATAPPSADGIPGAVPRPLTGQQFNSRQISQLPYLPGLDGIRAIAVVAVMVYHANSSWLAGGYLGVEVFFVISGYLITLLLIAEHERSGSIDLKNFWIRRFRRLLPALFVMMLLLSVWVALFKRGELGKLRGDVIAGVGYGSNWYQIFIGAGYSAGNDFAPLRHLWSLAVEEQFYVVWPLVMLGFVRFGSRGIASIARWLFLAAVAITVLVALLHHPSPQQTPELSPEAYWFIGDRPISKPDALYLSTITRAGGLLMGAAFAMIWRPTAIMRGPLKHKGRVFDVLALVGIAALGVMAWMVSFEPGQGVHAFLFRGGLFATGLASLALIAAVTHQGAATGRLLSAPVLLWIGTRSYGLYLYHWPIYQIIRDIAANKLRFHEFVLAMVATCIITELSYRFVETPIREGRLGELFGRDGSIRRNRSLTDAQRNGARAAGVVAVALSIFAVGSMATAELKQNDVAIGISEGEAATCDVLVDLDCDGVDDVDAEGNPLDADEADGVFDDGGETSEDLPDNPAPENDEVVEGDEADGVVPGSTEPPVFEPITRLAVGDSVMLGAAPNLTELGFTVDAQESRSFGNGLTFVESLESQGRLPELLVIHLGTNGPIGEDNMNQMMEAVAGVPQVLLVTNDVDRDWTSGNNSLIYGAAGANANVTLLDWEANAPGCADDCFESDGFHLKPAGRRYYTALIQQVLGL